MLFLLPFVVIPECFCRGSVVTKKGKGVGKYAKLSGYSANVASFKLIGKWIELLKQNGVYDNTKIIIAADHGIGQRKIVQDLYNGTLEDGFIMDHLNPMLLVKDFGASAKLRIIEKI